MTADPLACPFCNALVAVAPGAAAGERVPCPRCGEAFAPRPGQAASAEIQPAPPAASAAPVVAPDFTLRPVRSPRGKRLTLAAVLGVMGLMAAGGLALALYTVGERRDHDSRLPPPPKKPLSYLFPPRSNPDAPLPETPAEPTPPKLLAALGWLPADTTVIAGVHVAALSEKDRGRLPTALQEVMRLITFNAEDIDHFVVGVKAEDAFPQRTTLVVRTRRPYDADAVRAGLHAESQGRLNGKPVYRFRTEIRGPEKDADLWCADDRTLIVGLFDGRHLRAVPDRPDGIDHLPAAVRELLETRVETAPVWAVGASDDGWKNVNGALEWAGLLSKDGAGRLAKVRGFALSLRTDTATTLDGVLHCADAETAADLKRRADAARPASADWNVDATGPWLTLQLRGGLDDALKALLKQ
jgi:hypothetical protein